MEELPELLQWLYAVSYKNNNLLSAFSVPSSALGTDDALGSKQPRVLRSPTSSQNPTCDLSGLTIANYKVLAWQASQGTSWWPGGYWKTSSSTLTHTQYFSTPCSSPFPASNSSFHKWWEPRAQCSLKSVDLFGARPAPFMSTMNSGEASTFFIFVVFCWHYYSK